ncbi:MAG: caspase family protein, partial [Gammaproteobacteria bacterium]|nr:caspase family protein [Gammaproteobacteria bacterium]
MKRLNFLLPLLILLAPALSVAETKIALVIGNSAYASGPLPNPANDAELVRVTLERIGFRVIAKTDADQHTMKRAIQEFGKSLDDAGPQAVGLFYYAGHGVQLNGRNYLIPTRAEIEREGDLEIEAVSADWVLEQMRLARNGLNIVILDACRNNPFTRGMRSAERGLATMDAPTGILIAYSTAPGTVAEDGSGRNSPYTTALTQAMLGLHEPLEQLFKHVRVSVMKETSDKQVPWEYSSLTGADFCFSGCRAGIADERVPLTVPLPTGLPDTGGGESRGVGSSLSSLFASGFSWLSGLFAPATPAASALVTPKPVPPNGPAPAPGPESAG